MDLMRVLFGSVGTTPQGQGRRIVMRSDTDPFDGMDA